MLVSTHDVMLNQEEDPGRGQRSRKPTSKGLEYKTFLLKERKKEPYFRFTRKYSAVKELLYSTKNKIAEEEML